MTTAIISRSVVVGFVLIGMLMVPTIVVDASPSYACNVCQHSNQGIRYLKNPNKRFTMDNGVTWSCGDLQTMVQVSFKTKKTSLSLQPALLTIYSNYLVSCRMSILVGVQAMRCIVAIIRYLLKCTVNVMDQTSHHSSTARTKISIQAVIYVWGEISLSCLHSIRTKPWKPFGTYCGVYITKHIIPPAIC